MPDRILARWHRAQLAAINAARIEQIIARADANAITPRDWDQRPGARPVPMRGIPAIGRGSRGAINGTEPDLRTPDSHADRQAHPAQGGAQTGYRRRSRTR